MTGRRRLAVLGAINVDLVVSGAALPRSGETVSGGTFSEHQGGKGGNQAVAAARATSAGGVRGDGPELEVWMLGAVGDDGFGRSALQALALDGVRTEHVLISRDAHTGVALIVVDANGENQISVAAGANDSLDPTTVIGALEQLEPHMVLVSLEVPQAVATAVLEWCRDTSLPSVLNPAPSHPWARELARIATYVTPNQRELQALGRVSPEVGIIETLGADGAAVHQGDVVELIAAPAVHTVDTTGAGDCFNGVLAARLAVGGDLRGAVRDAVVAASISVCVSGAREGMPSATGIAEGRARLGVSAPDPVHAKDGDDDPGDPRRR